MTLKDYLTKDIETTEEENLNEAANIVEIRKNLLSLKPIEKRNVSFFLGRDWGKGKRDLVADVDLQKLNDKGGIIPRINKRIEEFNELMRQVKQDAIPDSEMNKGFIKRVKKIHEEIKEIEKRGMEVARQIESKVKEMEKRDEQKAQQERKKEETAKSFEKAKGVTRDKIEGMRTLGLKNNKDGQNVPLKFSETKNKFKKRVKKFMGRE